MDVSENYIKMCRQAKEIQEAWHFEDGDYLATKGGTDAGVWSGYSASDYPGYPQDGIWLPRQDQLQEIIKIEDKFGKNIWNTAKQFYEYIRSGCTYSDDRTFEQLWLMFVMKNNFSKIWNGEDWVKDD